MGKASFGFIEELKSKRFRARYRVNGRTFKAPHTFAKKRDAQAWLYEQATLLGADKSGFDELVRNQEAQAGSKGITVTDLASLWIKRLKADNRSPNTIRAYHSNLNAHILPYLGGFNVCTTTRKDIRRWWDDVMLEAGKKPSARSNAYRTLSALFTFAVDEEIIDVSPVRIKGACKPPKPLHKDREYVPSQLEISLLAAGMPEPWQIAIYLAAYAGLRFGEITGLQRRHIDLENHIIKIEQAAKRDLNGKAIIGKPKSDSSARAVPIINILDTLLRAHLNRFVPRGDNAFVIQPYGRGANAVPVPHSSFQRAFDKARDTANLGDFVFHQLRATCATHLMRAGATPREIMLWLGHTNWETSFRYQRATLDRLFEVGELLAGQWAE